MEKIPTTYYHKLWFTITERPAWGAIAWGLLIIAVAAIQLVDYLQLNINLILGLMILPMVWEIKQKDVYSWRFALGAIISLSLYAYLHAQVFFLLGVGMCLFWLVESRIGKMDLLPLIWLGLISPVTQYVVSAFSFPIRLRFSQWVADSFQLLGIDVSVSGNIFLWNGYEFSVDPVCMGLNSLITAWVIVTLFIAIQQQKTKKSAPLWLLVLIYLLTGVLSLLSNFFRITCLVLFRSMPETLSHEMIGLICLGVYVILPMYFIVLFIFRRMSVLDYSRAFFAKPLNLYHFQSDSVYNSCFYFCLRTFLSNGAALTNAFKNRQNMSKKSTQKSPTSKPRPAQIHPRALVDSARLDSMKQIYSGSEMVLFTRSYWRFPAYVWARRSLSTIFFLSICFLVWKKDVFRKEIFEGRVVEAKIDDLQMEVLATGIVKHYAEDILIYIKPPTRFWGVSHSPEICWEGSGYTLAHIWETEVCGQKIYMGELKKDKEKLFTAWWYENEDIRTHRQWEWRSKTAQGQAPFSLVNLSTISEEKLLLYCEKWLEKDILLVVRKKN